MTLAHTVYICPLCGARIPHYDIPPRRNEDGGWTVETPLGSAMRIEAVLGEHFAVAHDMTPAQVVEHLEGGDE